MNESGRRLSPDRRQRIVEAAKHLVLKQGVRATTMEAVAREARIAKPTLYGYFPDKDAVFSAIVAAVCEELGEEFDKALASEGTAVARIGAALSAKYRVISKLLEGSPHADELYSEHDRSTAMQFAAVESRIETAITDVLAAAGALKPRALAQLLLASAYGIGRKAHNSAEIGPAIRLTVERLAAPELELNRDTAERR